MTNEFPVLRNASKMHIELLLFLFNSSKCQNKNKFHQRGNINLMHLLLMFFLQFLAFEPLYWDLYVKLREWFRIVCPCRLYDATPDGHIYILILCVAQADTILCWRTNTCTH
jgi:hypothetical protein